jgi:sulfatase modifying factor 1
VEVRHVAVLALLAGGVGAVLVAIRPIRKYAVPALPIASSAPIVEAAPAPPPSVAPPPPEPPPPWSRPSLESADACPDGMLLVDGSHCPFVAHRCADGDAARCHRYVPEVLCEGKARRVRVCVDRLEYPNLEGVRPASGVSFEDAGRACAAESKRLCTMSEWELACEGPEIWPMPIGVRRDPRRCVMDRGSFARDRLPPAGSETSCASTFGVLDMMGGVAEWVVDPAGTKTNAPFAWVLEGGSAAAGRACRDPVRDARTAGVTDAGFRCCVEPATAGPGAQPPPPPSRAPAPASSGEAPLGGWRALHVPDPPPASNSAGHGLTSPP